MVKVVTFMIVVVGATLLVVGILRARSVPTSEGAGEAAVLITVGAALVVGAGALALVLRRCDGR